MTESRGLIDLQVNGFAGVDFNSDSITEEAIFQACQAIRESGTSQILATLITDEVEAMQRRARKLVRAIEQYPEVRGIIVGLHLEGPFISPVGGYVGAHPTPAVRPATVDLAQRLLESCGGYAKLVTLAPECDDDCATTRMLVDQKVRVAAGHCNPTGDQLDRAIDAGLSLFTHLGNGCPLELPRHDNVIQRVLSRTDRLRACFIADGIHVPFFALKNYLAAAGIDRAIVVSDAIAAAGKGPGIYTLAGRQVVVDDDLCTWSEDRSHLVGSALSLPHAFDRLQSELGLSEADAMRLTRENPLAVLAD